MRHVLLVSHGEFAPGLHKALEMLAGEREDLMSVSLKNGMGQDEFADEVRNLLKVVKADDELIVFADIIGGSPLTTTADVASELGILENTRMIGGMNLPLVLTTLVEDEGVNDEIIENAREQIKEFRIEASVDDDEI